MQPVSQYSRLQSTPKEAQQAIGGNDRTRSVEVPDPSFIYLAVCLHHTEGVGDGVRDDGGGKTDERLTEEFVE